MSDFDLQTDAQTMDRRDGVVVIRLMVPGVVSAPGRYRIKLAEPLPVHVDTEVVKAEVWWPDMRDLVVATDRPQAVSADDQFEVIVHFEDLGSFVPEPFNGR